MVNGLVKRVEKNISSELLYSSLYWVNHVVDYLSVTSSSEKDGSRDQDKLELSRMLADFLSTERSLYWLEVLSLTGNLEYAENILNDINENSHLPASFRFLKAFNEC